MFYPFTLLRIDSLPPKPQKDLHAEILLLGLEHTSRSKLQEMSDEDLYKITDALATDFAAKREQASQRTLVKRFRKQFDILNLERKRRRANPERETL